jgi:hypothetical protein
VLIIEHALHYSMILRVYYIFKGVINLSQGEVSIHFNFYELVKEYMDLGEEPANLPIHALNLPQIFWPSLLNIFFLYFLKTKTLTNNKNTKHSSKKQFSPLCNITTLIQTKNKKYPPFSPKCWEQLQALHAWGISLLIVILRCMTLLIGHNSPDEISIV